MAPLKIDDIQALYGNSMVVMTQHFFEKIRSRGILLSDVKAAIVSGIVVETYPDDFPHPSALILGYSDNKPLHVVVGVGGGFLWLITSYWPDAQKWEIDKKTRKVSE